MSLDITLTTEVILKRTHSGIFMRTNGGLVAEVSRNDWDDICPGHTPTVVEEFTTTEVVFDGNITHNLNTMAEQAGIYLHMWRPEEINIYHAVQLIEPLRAGLDNLLENPTHYNQFNPINGWGSYDTLVSFVRSYVEACEMHTDATISVCR